MQLYHHLVSLFAGMSFFMFGMNTASENLQNLAAERLRQLMAQIAKHKFVAILSGVLLTTILQSSSAVTVMLVNLASAGVVTLRQVMGVVVGTAIGTTVTVQLISFNVTEIAPYVLIVGFAVVFLSREKKAKNIGFILFGFGLLFFGLKVMGDALSFIKDSTDFQNFFKFLNENPMVAFGATAVFTAVAHSSAITVVLAMTLATSGVITLYDSMFWVAGANLGTTATAIFASFQSKHAGKQVAWAHFYYKAASVILLLFLAKPFEVLISQTSSIPSHQIANSHTLFNILSGIIFYPLIGFGVKFIERVFPKPSGEKEFGAKYLDNKAFQEPQLAYANALREMLRMADYAFEMVRLSIFAFEKDNPDKIDEIKTIDKKIDTLNREIKLYLVRLGDENLTEVQRTRVVSLIALVSDIENVGDVVDANILFLARKKSNLKVTFSDQGWKEISHFHNLVVKNFELSISAFSLGSRELAQKVIDNKHEIRVTEQKFREAHIQRLNMKMIEALNTSNIHFDLLSAYRRVNSYVCNMVYPILFGDPKSFETGVSQKDRKAS